MPGLHIIAWCARLIHLPTPCVSLMVPWGMRPTQRAPMTDLASLAATVWCRADTTEALLVELDPRARDNVLVNRILVATSSVLSAAFTIDAGPADAARDA